MPFALDYSGRPVPFAAEVSAAGYFGVIRYAGFPGRAKCVTTAEYVDMDRHGVGVALVFEDQGGDALGGRPAGRQAAQLARDHARAIGFPADRPIYYAVDTDIVTAADFDHVVEYLRGAGDVELTPALVGVYGEHDVIEQAAKAGVARWFWQTRAWSHGVITPLAHLVQEIGPVTVGQVDCDRNTIRVADWGQHNAAREDVGELSASDADRVIAEVHQARDVLYNLTRALTPAGDPDPGHAEQAVTTANTRISAVGRAVATQATTLAQLTQQVQALAAGQQALADAVQALVGQSQVAGDLTVSGTLHVTEGPAQ